VRVYFDTNILNSLAYVENYDYIFQRMREKGHFVCISEVTIFEVLRDQSDLENIDKIITMLQSVSDLIIILPSTSEILISFLEGRKIKTEKNILHKVLFNKNSFFKIKDNNSKKNIEEYKSFSKNFRKEIKKLYKNPECEKCGERYCDNKISEISNIFIEIFLIYEFNLILKNKIKFYWRKRFIFSEIKKYEHIKSLENILLSEISPFRQMGRFGAIESKERNNGIFGDCLHMLYLNFLDILVSNDGSYRHVTKSMNLEDYLKSINIKIVWDEQNKIVITKLGVNKYE